MASSVIIRPIFGRILSVVTALIIAFSIVNLVSTGNMDALARYVWPLLLLGYLVWIAFWHPCVAIDDARVRLVNVFRTIDVPYAAIQRLDTRFALTLFTSEGRFVAWAAPAPGRHTAARTAGSDAKNLPASSYVRGTVRASDVPKTDSGDAATIIRLQLEELTGPGRPDTHDAAPVQVRLHIVQLVVVGVLLIGTILGAVL